MTRWVRTFRDVLQERTDLSRPGQELEVLLENLIMNIGTAIKRNRSQNTREVATELHCSIGTVRNIVHDQSISFFSDLLPNFPNHWDACLNALGDCFYANLFVCYKHFTHLILLFL